MNVFAHPTATAAAVEQRWNTRLLVANVFQSGDGPAIEVVNPATEAVLATVSSASLAQLNDAVGSARDALSNPAWANPALRRDCLHRLANLMDQHADTLMAALVDEIGTPIGHKGMQVDAALAFLRWFADASTLERAYQLPALAGSSGTSNRIEFRPSGVVGAIIAYNYPLILFATKVGAALAAGCTLVLLPSPQAPLTILLLGELIRQAGFPPGVVNLLVGGPDVGKALCEHPGVDKVSFTGSVGVGKMIMQQAATGIRGVVLELGGKSAAIMMPGVDYRKYALRLHSRYLQNAGQGCGSPTRILVERSRLDEFIEESVRAYREIRVGNPWHPDTLVGPVISAVHRHRIEHLVREAVSEGAEIVAGGSAPTEQCGWYVNPTLIANVTNRARIAREEIFGPVGVVLPYDSVDEAIHIANDSELGLKAYLYGRAEDCLQLAPRLRVGTVTINGGAGLRADAPMGGFKQSGLGREWGEEGVREFLETQHIDCAELRG